MCEACEMQFMVPRTGRARHDALRAELADSCRRLGHILLEGGGAAGRSENDPIVPPRLRPIAVLISAKIRDLAIQVEATRPR